MKRFLTIMAIVCAFAMVASSAFAYQEAFNVSQHRTQSRNATVGSVDAAYYNPAGLVGLEDGLFIDAGNRVLGLNTENTIEGNGSPFAALLNNDIESSTITWLLPNFAAVYKTGNAALFYAMDIREGGAGGLWEDDDSVDAIGALLAAKYGITTDGAAFNGTNGYTSANADEIEGSTYTFGHTIGGSFKVNDMFSFAAGLRWFKKIYDIEIAGASGIDDYESHQSWEGYAGFLGLLVTPMDGLNVSLQYQGRSVKMATTEEAYTFDGGADAYSVSPSIFLLGVGYAVTPELEVMFSYNREFTDDWDKWWAKDADYPNASGNKDKQVFGLGAEYTVMPALLVSAGVSYKVPGTANKNNNNPTDPSFKEIDFGFGGVYTAMPGLDVEAAVGYNYYLEAESTLPAAYGGGDITHNRSAWVIGLGVTYKAL